MSETTSRAVHNATQDIDLRNRLVAAAAIAGVPNPQAWVAEHIYALAVADISGTDTIASVYQYAVDVMPLPPGKNPAAVTDANLSEAVQAVLAAPTE